MAGPKSPSSRPLKAYSLHPACLNFALDNHRYRSPCFSHPGCTVFQHHHRWTWRPLFYTIEGKITTHNTPFCSIWWVYVNLHHYMGGLRPTARLHTAFSKEGSVVNPTTWSEGASGNLEHYFKTSSTLPAMTSRRHLRGRKYLRPRKCSWG